MTNYEAGYADVLEKLGVSPPFIPLIAGALLGLGTEMARGGRGFTRGTLQKKFTPKSQKALARPWGSGAKKVEGLLKKISPNPNILGRPRYIKKQPQVKR